MATFTIRWYYEDDVKRWEALERRGKISTGQAGKLNAWRVLKAANPSMISMEVHGKRYMVGKRDIQQEQAKYTFRDKQGNILTGARLRQALERRIENERAVIGKLWAERSEAEKPSKKREYTLVIKVCEKEIVAMQALIDVIPQEQA